MEIIGHRGAKGIAPENSLEAIRKAIKAKVAMIEVDVRMQASTVVLSHDKTMKEQIYCPLTHALNEVQGKVPLNLEIKEQKVVKQLPKLLKDYKGDILFSSVKYGILQDIKELLPKSDIALIERWSGVKGVAQAELLKTKRLHMNHRWLWSGFVKSMKTQGYSLYAYTVNDLERAEELKSWGVDGIFTDYPDKVKV